MLSYKLDEQYLKFWFEGYLFLFCLACKKCNMLYWRLQFSLTDKFTHSWIWLTRSSNIIVEFHLKFKSSLRFVHSWMFIVLYVVEHLFIVKHSQLYIVEKLRKTYLKLDVVYKERLNKVENSIELIVMEVYECISCKKLRGVSCNTT